MSEHLSIRSLKKWYRITECYPINPTDKNLLDNLGATKYAITRRYIIGTISYPKSQMYMVELLEDDYIFAKLSLY